MMVTSCMGFKGADDAFDADPGGVLDAVGYGRRGYHYGQVSPGSLTLVVVDRPGLQVVLAHPEGRLDVPQFVIRGDDLSPAPIKCAGMLVT